MKKVCPVCRSNVDPLKSEIYISCPVCDCRFIQNLPTEKTLQKMSNYWGTRNISVSTPHLTSQTDYLRIKRLSHYIQPQSKILDVGCGTGNFLREARRNGYHGTGMDIALPVIRYLTKQDIPVVSSLHKLGAQTFDAVVSFDVLEHLNNPHTWLSHIRRILKANGVFMISTPNAGGISSRILGRYWWVFGPADHVILYRVKTLEKLLTMHGFQILSIRTDTLTPWAYPPNTLLRRLINKIVYVFLFTRLASLFRRFMGDNIECIAKCRR